VTYLSQCACHYFVGFAEDSALQHVFDQPARLPMTAACLLRGIQPCRAVAWLELNVDFTHDQWFSLLSCVCGES